MVLEYHYIGIVWEITWDPNKVIDLGERSRCAGGRLEGCYYIYKLSSRPPPYINHSPVSIASFVSQTIAHAMPLWW